MIKLVTGTLIVLMTACNSSKETADKAMENTSSNLQTEKMLAAGFTSGTIETAKEEGDCEVMIKVEDGRYFESLEIPEEFTKDGTKVWFTYTPQRRMSRCQKANPIAIKDIKARE